MIQTYPIVDSNVDHPEPSLIPFLAPQDEPRRVPTVGFFPEGKSASVNPDHHRRTQATCVARFRKYFFRHKDIQE
jgi:hypothetical protein